MSEYVLKKGDRSNSSNYRSLALLSCLSKGYHSILKWEIQKHCSTSDILSDRQYGFRKGRSTGVLLTLLTDSWSSSLSRFGEIFSVAPDISKTFNRAWHKSLLYKLPSFGFHPSLCSFVSSFICGRSISVVVDGQCSSPKVFHRVLFYNPLSSCCSSMIFPLQTVLSIHMLTTLLCTFRQTSTEDPQTGLTRLQTGGGKELN